MAGFNFRRRYGPGNINGGFPHQVAFKIAERGPSELMDEYCSARTLSHRTRRDMRGYLRYCFARQADADGFAATFGGERIDIATTEAPESRLKARK